MAKQQTDTLNLVFSALADPTRRALVARLAEGESTVTEIAEPFKMSLPAISKHLRVLEEAGLMQRRIEGRKHYLSLNAAPMQSVAAWLAMYRAFWEDSFDALAHLVEEEESD